MSANSSSAEDKANEWFLRAESGPLTGKMFPLGKRVVVGRALTCDISIPEERLSREHAELRIENNELSIRDLGSSNGTFLNDDPVTDSTGAKHGDALRFDTVAFRIIGPANDMDKTVIGNANDIRAAAEAARAKTRQAPAVELPDEEDAGGISPMVWVAVGVGALIVIGAVAFLLM